MYRKDLIDLLWHRPMHVAEIARQLDVPPQRVVDDLNHLSKSLRRSDMRMEVRPAACRKCGFGFSADKLGKPGKCPRCHGTWIEPPAISIREK